MHICVHMYLRNEYTEKSLEFLIIVTLPGEVPQEEDNIKNIYRGSDQSFRTSTDTKSTAEM